MIEYMRHHLVNGWSWMIIAFYPLLPVGAALVAVGLWRSGQVTVVATLLLTVPLFALVVPPLCPPTAVLGVALGAGFLAFARGANGSSTAAPQVPFDPGVVA
jgi:hypothetical protein